MGRPRAKPGVASTRERLLAAAELEFAGIGFYAARLEDIAGRAGIRRPSLLHYFPTKRILYEHVVRRTFDHLGAALSVALRARGSAPEMARALAEAFSGYMERRPALAAIVLREFLDGSASGRRILLRELNPVLRRVEAALESAAHGRRTRLPLRAAVLQVAAGALLRASAGTLRRPLWGDRDPSGSLAEALLS